MKNITLFILVLTLFCMLAQPSFAKKKHVIEADNESVQMVKQLTETGNVQRTSDIPHAKVDVEADTQRSARLHAEFAQQKYHDTKAYMNIWGKDINLDPVLDAFNLNNENPDKK